MARFPAQESTFLHAFPFRQGQPFRLPHGIAAAVSSAFQFHRNCRRSEYSCDPSQYAAYKCPLITHVLAPLIFAK